MKKLNNLLKNHLFKRLWAANLFSNIGDSLDNIVITLLAINLTNSGSATGYLLSIASIPGVVLSIIGGTISDTKKKNQILIIMTSIQGAIIMVMAIFVIAGRITFNILCLFLFLLECCSRFYSPAFTSLNVSIVEKEEYSRAQSFITTTNSLAQMIGSSVCTSLITLFGYSIPLLINFAFYFISGLIVGTTKFTKDIITNNTEDNKKSNFISEIKNGIKYLSGKTLLIKLIIILTSTNFCLALFDVGLPFLLSDSLSLPTEYLGYMKSVSTFAFIIAGVVTTKLTIKKPLKLISISIMVMSFSVLGISISKCFILSSVLWGIAAFFRTILVIVLMSNIATLPSKAYVGRITGIVATLSYIIILISRGISGLLVDNFSATSIFLISGIFFLLLAIVSAFSSIKEQKWNDHKK